MYYILEGQNPVQIEDREKWAMWCFGNTENRRIAYSKINDYEVSTVFLGLDHSFNNSENRTPILFETAVFLNNDTIDIFRYSSLQAAQKGHKEAIQKCAIEK